MLPPKSAAVRIKSKKISAVKDIEEWAFTNTEVAHETSRHSGHLAENVTEERLLRAKLIEMGKERFKFLAKATYEKQSFIDKQKKKFALLRKKRVSSRMCRSAPSSQSILSKVDRDTNLPTTPFRHPSPIIRPKTVQFEPDKRYRSTPSNYRRPNTVPTKKKGDGMFFTEYPLETAPSSVSSDWSRPSTAGTFSSGTWMADKKVNPYGSKFPSLTRESRFSDLERALSENYISRSKHSVKTIIERIESLRKPSKLGAKEARRELELKVREFMKEAGIVF